MNPDDALGCLESKWRDYLEERGHFVYQTRTCQPAIRSRKGKKARYRWLLLIGHDPRRILSKSEQSNVRRHLRQAKTQKEVTYLVVGFIQEPGRIIILPANSALKAQCFRSDTGGIAWGD